MLILTRRVGEKLVLGTQGEITLTVLGIKGNQVRIGTDAPKEMPVHREEIFHRIQMEAKNDNNIDELMINKNIKENNKQ